MDDAPLRITITIKATAKLLRTDVSLTEWTVCKGNAVQRRRFPSGSKVISGEGAAIGRIATAGEPSAPSGVSPPRGP